MKSISIKQDSINFKNKMLSIGEERELFIKYREYNDNDAKNKILTFNTPLVIYIIKKFELRNVEYQDFLQEGLKSLEKAINDFDYNRSIKFSTYAYHSITGSLQSYLLEQNETIKLTKKEKQLLKIWLSAINSLTNMLGREPNEVELIDYLSGFDINAEQIRQIEYKFYSVYPKKINVEDVEKIYSLDSEEKSYNEDLNEQYRKELLYKALELVTPFESEILTRRFGLNGQPTQTLQEIANIYGYSRERIRQIQAKAMYKIERAIKEKI